MKQPKYGMGLIALATIAVLSLLTALAWAAAGTVTYQYDEAGRLRTTAFDNTANRTYTLDAAGNRTLVAESLGNGAFALSVASSVNEGAGSVTVTVNRNGSSAGAVSVSYATANGTAVAGSDYTAVSGTLSWANGNATAQTFSIPILNDTVAESSENFTVTLSAPTGGAVITAPVQATITITDNDDGTPPSIPTGLSGTAVGTSQVNLTWSASTDTGGSGLAGYKIYRNSVQLSTSATTSYNDTNVAAGNNYAYNVSAYDNAGNNSSQSATINVQIFDHNAPVITVGRGFDFTGSVYVSGYQLYYPGWPQVVGSINPTTDSTGKTYQYIEDAFVNLAPAGSYFALYVPSGVNPGAAYLTSVNANGVTKTGVSATYSWDASNNWAEWYWVGQFGFDLVVGQQKTVTVAINPPETTPPSAPGTPSFSNVTGTTATASWSAATDNVGVTAYEYSLNGGAWTSVGNVLSVNLTGLSGSANYTLAVHAKDAAGNTGTASSNSFTTADISAPTAPGAPSFSSITATTATASWSAATDNIGVTTYEYSLNGGAWTSVGNVLSINLSGLTSVTAYTLAVHAKDAAGNTSTASSNSFTTLDNIAPTAPGTPSFSSITTTTATASWSAATDNVSVTAYEYSLNGGAWTSVGNVLSVNLTGLSNGTSYTVAVHAKDAAGNTSAASSNSFTAADTTAPTVPTGLSGTAVSSSQVNLTWTASTDTGGSGLTGYKIYRNSVQVGTSVTASYSDTSATTGSLSYTVAAYDNAGNNSAQSTSITVLVGGGNAPVMTVGFGYASGGSGYVTGYQLYYPGYPQVAGSISPTTDSTGKTYQYIEDYWYYDSAITNYSPGGSYFALYVPSGVNPGAAYLTSINVNGVTRTGASATYSWDASNNWAQWYWTGQFGFSSIAGQQKIATIAINPPETTPPSAPGTPSFSSITGTTATASWSAATDNVGVTAYEYSLNGGAWTSIGNVLSVNLSGLTGITNYAFSVRAKDAAGNIGSTSSNSFTTLDNVAPSAPGAPSFSSIAATTATASWSAASDNVGVTAYEYSLNGGTWTSVGNVLSVNLSGLSSATAYTLAMRARDAAGNTGSASSNSFTTLDNIAPTAPGTPSFSSISTTTATASWSAASDNVGVTSYEYSLNGGAWTSIGNALSVNLTGLSNSTSYTVAVHAKDAAGNTGTASSNSFTTASSGSNTPVISVNGSSDTSGWYAVYGYQLSYPGWPGVVGSISPTTDSTGKTYQYIEDYWYLDYDYNDYNYYWFPAGSYFALYVPNGVDPGASYLTSVSANGVTLTGASANYSWSPTTQWAEWRWATQFNFSPVVGQQKTATVVHQ